MENLNNGLPSSSYTILSDENVNTSSNVYQNGDHFQPQVGSNVTVKSKVMTSPNENDKETEDYLRRRRRNNEAVKKSREKTKERTMSTLQKVEQLKSENLQLETKVEILQKELSILKDLFMEHARGFCTGEKQVKVDQAHLEALLGCKFKENAFGNTLNNSEQAESSSSAQIQPLITAVENEYTNLADNVKMEPAQSSSNDN